jgi:hypothetical protein
MLRPGKKKTRKTDGPPPQVDPQKLKDAQSVRRAVVAAIAAILILSCFWMFFTDVTGRVFPWFSVVQGVLTGDSHSSPVWLH